MGKITLTVEGTTVGTVANGGGIVIQKEVSEADSTRLIQAFATIYGPSIEGEVTATKVIEAWWKSMVESSVARVLQIEKEIAAKNASERVTEISIT